MSLVLFKIPCILVAMVGLQNAYTPPHQPPSADEVAASTGLELVIKQRSAPFVVKSIGWVIALGEFTAILTTFYTGKPHSILPFLAPNPSAGLEPTKLFFLGTFLTAFGGVIRHSCYLSLGHLFTFEMSIRKDHKLVTTGPYRFVRHPGYTGIIFTNIGIILWHTAPGSWARESGLFGTIWGQVASALYISLVGVVTTGLMFRMPKEDVALRERFGSQWDQWAVRVPYNLIPGIY